MADWWVARKAAAKAFHWVACLVAPTVAQRVEQKVVRWAYSKAACWDARKAEQWACMMAEPKVDQRAASTVLPTAA